MTLTEFLTYASPYVVAVLSVLLTSWRADVRQRQQLAALEASRTSEKLADVIDEAYTTAEEVVSLAGAVIDESRAFRRSSDVPSAWPMRDKYADAVPRMHKATARLSLYLGSDSQLASTYFRLFENAHAIVTDSTPDDTEPRHLHAAVRLGEALDIWREAAALTLGVARTHRTLAANTERLLQERLEALLNALPAIHPARTD